MSCRFRLAPWFHTRIPDGWMSVHNQLVWREHQGAACFWHHTRDYSIIIIQPMFGEAFFCVSLVGYWTWKGSLGIEINPSFAVEGSVNWMPVPKMTWTISLPPLRHVPASLAKAFSSCLSSCFPVPKAWYIEREREWEIVLGSGWINVHNFVVSWCFMDELIPHCCGFTGWLSMYMFGYICTYAHLYMYVHL